MNGMYGYPDMGGYYYDPYTMPDATGFAEGFAGAFFAMFFVFYLVILALEIVVYVLQSVGLYTIAKRRGIYHPWLAWLPLGNMWILGSISDQYQYVSKGKVRSRRKILLGLTIAVFVLCFVYIFSVVGAALGSAVGANVAIVLLSALAMLVLAIVMMVQYYFALYDLYISCEPGNATAYLVLSILFNVTMPFFVFLSRKKDAGMPPRKVQQPVLEIPEQPAEPEETFE